VHGRRVWAWIPLPAPPPGRRSPCRSVSADHWPPSLHLVGSKALGGAERWVHRFALALAEEGAPAVVGVRAGGDLAGIDLGLPVRALPFRTVWDPLSRRAVSRLIAELEPAIVQTYMGRATRTTRLPPRERRAAGPVHLARLGGYYALGPYRHADAWIGNTRGLCDWMVRQGLPADRVHHIYNFADPARPRPAADVEALRLRLGIPADASVLLCLGRLVPVKGHAGLLQAAALLPQRIDDRPWRLVLVGDGPLRAGLERQAADLGLSDRLIWAGWQQDPGRWLQLADLVVFPSRDAETLGNVILEAWAWQRPLVTTAFRGAREIAHHGADAWCVPCDDPTGLAAGIRTLLADAGLRHALVQRGAARVATEFGKDAILAQYRALYHHLMRA